MSPTLLATSRPRRIIALTATALVASSVAVATTPMAAQAAVSCAPGKPTLTSVVLSKSKVDVTKKGATVTVTLKAKDSTQPITSISVDVVSPAKSGITHERYVAMSLTGGTTKSGTWRGTIGVARYEIAGTWKIRSVYLADLGRGYASYNPWASSGYPSYAVWKSSWARSFNVISPKVDLVAPTLTKLTFSRTSITTTSKAANVSVSAKVHDSLAGAASLYLVATRAGSTSHTLYIWMSLTGSGATRSAAGTLAVPKWAGSKATWNLQANLYDRVDNHRTYTTAKLKSVHLTSKLTITSGTDTSKPTLSSLSVSPTKVDIRSASKKVSFTASLADTKSGVYYAYVTITGSNGYTSTEAYLAPTTSSKTWKGSVTVARCALPAGTATLSVQIYDKAGNYGDISSATLKARKIRSTISVIAG